MLEVELEWYVVKHDAEDKIKTNLWQYSAYIEHYLRVNEVIRNEDLGYTLTKINNCISYIFIGHSGCAGFYICIHFIYIIIAKTNRWGTA